MFSTRRENAPAIDDADEAMTVRLRPSAGALTRLFKVLAIVVPSGVGGNLLGDYLQNRSWEYQHAIEGAAGDAQAAENALQRLSDQLDERWLATDHLFRVNGKDDEKVDGITREDLIARFYEADAKWNSARNGMLASLQFDVDAPFGVDGVDPAEAVGKLDCKADPLADAANISDKPSARLLFQISDHCMFDLKNELDTVIRENETSGAWKGFDPRHVRLDYVFRANSALRCLVAERALAIRMDYSPPSLFLALAFGGASKPYVFPSVRSGECGLPDKVDRQPAVASLAP